MSTNDPRWDLRALVDDYAHACDTRDADLLVSLFASDASMVVCMPGSKPSPRSVPEDVRNIPTTLARFERTLHFVGNQRVVLDGVDRARGDTYCFAHHISDHQDLIMAIHYRDSYVVERGKWRFGARDVNVLWTETRPVS